MFFTKWKASPSLTAFDLYKSRDPQVPQSYYHLLCKLSTAKNWKAACKAATIPLSLCVLPWFRGRGWTTSALDYCPVDRTRVAFLGWNSAVLLCDTHGLLRQPPQSNNTMAILSFPSSSQILSPPNSSTIREPLNTGAFV